jgi:hypothetical protein
MIAGPARRTNLGGMRSRLDRASSGIDLPTAGGLRTHICRSACPRKRCASGLTRPRTCRALCAHQSAGAMRSERAICARASGSVLSTSTHLIGRQTCNERGCAARVRGRVRTAALHLAASAESSLTRPRTRRALCATGMAGGRGAERAIGARYSPRDKSVGSGIIRSSLMTGQAAGSADPTRTFRSARDHAHDGRAG